MLDESLDVEVIRMWKGKVINIDRGIRIWKAKAFIRREERLALLGTLSISSEFGCLKGEKKD